MTKSEHDQLMARLGALHNRINEIASLEARSALVAGWAAQGHLMPEKLKLIEQGEEILDKLMGSDGA
jgi:hypothetical protein